MTTVRGGGAVSEIPLRPRAQEAVLRPEGGRAGGQEGKSFCKVRYFVHYFALYHLSGRDPKTENWKSAW